MMEYGLIGEKLSHSFSKEIHEALGLYNYELCEIKPAFLGDFFAQRNFKGINVTIPYKCEVIKYLDFVDDTVKSTGACNTVVNIDGKLYGYNTDYYGFFAAVSDSGIRIKGATALILGSGGTSKTVFSVLKNLGADKVFVVSRNPANDDTINYCDAYKIADSIDIIVNTTPVGMFPNIYDTPIDCTKFPNAKALFDVIYNPLSTRLITDAKRSGKKAYGGLYMLVFQALKSASIFTQNDEVLKNSYKIYKSVKNSKQNIVLIGMPGCGKTTLGKRIAKEFSRPFYDSDALFEQDFGKISDFLKSNTEEVFRKRETDIISRLAKLNGCVIATGGGVVTRKENIDKLKQNSVIVFVNRPLKLLNASKGRPLTSSMEMLKEKFRQRIPLYKKYADIEVKVFAGVKSSAERTITAINNYFGDF